MIQFSGTRFENPDFIEGVQVSGGRGSTMDFHSVFANLSSSSWALCSAQKRTIPTDEARRPMMQEFVAPGVDFLLGGQQDAALGLTRP